MKKFKYKTLIIFSIIFSIFMIDNVHALSMGRVTNEGGVTVRTAPGTNSNKIDMLEYNDVAVLYSTITYDGSGCSDGWYKINHNGTTGYICAAQVSVSLYSAKVDNTSNVNIRSGAGTNYSIYTKLANNKMITLDSTEKIKGQGCSDGWYAFSYNRNTRYICSTYVDNIKSIGNAIVTQTSGLNLRKNATINSEIINFLKYGQVLTLDSTNTYKGTGCSSGFYKVYYKGEEVYACSSNLTNSSILGVVNNAFGLTIREKASTSSSKITLLDEHEKVTVLETKKYSGTGCSSGFYKVSLNGKTRYACSSYIATTDISTNINTNGTNIRKGAGTNYSKITSLNKNDIVYLLDTKKYSGTGCSSGFYKISINATTGYVCSSYTDLGKATGSTNDVSKTVTKKVTKTEKRTYYTTNKWTYRINEDYAGVLTSPTGSRIELIYLGTEVKPISTSGEFTKIKYYNGKTGYVLTRLIDKYEDVTLENNEYCELLKKEGFPESYCPYLSYLHSKYPNWIFKADKSDYSFDEVIEGETSKNYTQVMVDEYLESWNISESGGWRTSSDSYNAYMLDPRTYLTEKNIFVFEDLGYDSTNHTKSVIRSIVDGTYLDTDTYAGYFLDAGKKYNISPVHLAARVKQEGGTNSSYDPVSGKASETWNISNSAYICASSSYGEVSGSYFKVKSGTNLNVRKGAGTNYSRLKYANGNYVTVNSNDKVTIKKKGNTGSGCSGNWYEVKINKSLKGIYNYYNIGAYGKNPVLRGLAAAAGYVDDLDGVPWNSREKAIKYGAKFIADGYINAGQETMYYQKFNTGPNATNNSFAHQYMTNILAPASESLSTYYSYDDLNILKKSLVFKIPVYKNMPNELISHPPVESISKHLNTLK